jgi:hypothetical protein
MKLYPDATRRRTLKTLGPDEASSAPPWPAPSTPPFRGGAAITQGGPRSRPGMGETRGPNP